MAFGGMERTEDQWSDLLNGVGLGVVRVEYPDQGSQSPDYLIEAKLFD